MSSWITEMQGRQIIKERIERAQDPRVTRISRISLRH
jgi:hypothetical protein